MHLEWCDSLLTDRKDKRTYACVLFFHHIFHLGGKSQVVLTYWGNLSSSSVTVLSRPAERVLNKCAGQYLICCTCTDPVFDWVGNGSEQSDADALITDLGTINQRRQSRWISRSVLFIRGSTYRDGRDAQLIWQNGNYNLIEKKSTYVTPANYMLKLSVKNHG